ncbi:hypothetical protein BRADO3752 [Bradyrhizobium sp. ORS 278]|nr:hypothetical protein BRADO3752 [Bradyrhizobium sp. ORS 278]
MSFTEQVHRTAREADRPQVFFVLWSHRRGVGDNRATLVCRGPFVCCDLGSFDRVSAPFGFAGAALLAHDLASDGVCATGAALLAHDLTPDGVCVAGARPRSQARLGPGPHGVWHPWRGLFRGRTSCNSCCTQAAQQHARACTARP